VSARRQSPDRVRRLRSKSPPDAGADYRADNRATCS
jgi:hypothetical protein